MVLSSLKSQKKNDRLSDKSFFWLAFLVLLLAANGLLFAPLAAFFSRVPLFVFYLLNGFCLLTTLWVRALRSRAPRRLLAVGRFASVWNIWLGYTAIFWLLFRPLSATALGVQGRFYLSFAVASCVCMYALYEARRVRSIFISLSTDKVLPESGSLRLVQLSDLHLGGFVTTKHLERIVSAVQKHAPDLIVITGDVVDGALPPDGQERSLLRRMTLHSGVWAVPGNHDHYENIDTAVAFMNGAGVHVLRSEVVDVGEIVLVGLDDPDHLVLEQGETRSQRVLRTLTEQQKQKFVLVLRHRPVIEEGTLGLFDLQLSGHTHGGQLFPLPSSRHKFPGHSRGIRNLGGGSALYVNNGVGFVGPPMRFLAPAEITVIDLYSACRKSGCDNFLNG